MPTIIVNEFRVNTHTNDRQDDPAIATLANGNYVVVWSSYNQDVSTASSYGVYAQLFNASGSPLGSELHLNTYLIGDQSNPSVAALTNGSFVVTWHSYGQPPDNSSFGIFARLVDASGNPQGSSEFLVNTHTNDYQNYPSVAGLTNGNFVVVWHSNGQDGSNTGIYGQRFDASGSALGSEFRVNTYTSGLQQYPYIAALTNGNFVVTWASSGQDGAGYGIYGQRFDANGSALGSEFRVNTYTAYDQNLPVIAGLTNGNFVVAWNSNNQDGSTGGVYSQLYNGSGGLVGSEFRVNTNTTSNQNDPSIAALANGKFVVVWVSYGQDGSGAGVYGQLFSASGSPIGSEFPVNAYTTGDQADTAIAALANENFVVAWASNGQDGSNYGVYSQIFSTLTVNNVNQIDTYTEDSTKDLSNIEIVYAINNQATAKLTLAPSTAGSLSTGTSGSVTSTYNASTGVWQASGNIANVNTLLGSIQFSPAANYNANVTISVSIMDNGGAIETGNIALTGIAVNDPLVLSSSNTDVISFTDNNSVVVVNPNLTINNIDTENLTNATVTVVGYVVGEDVLVLPTNPQNDITATFDSTTGVLTLTGSSTVANYQAALRSVTYQNPNNTVVANRSVEFLVNNGIQNSNSLTRDIKLVPLNTLLSGINDGLICFNQDQGEKIIVPQVNIKGGNALTLENATVTVSNPVSAEDTLEFTDLSNGITGNYDSNTGVLTLTGPATASGFAATLQTVKYKNSNGNTDSSTKTFTVAVNYAGLSSNTLQAQIDLITVNDAPVVINPVEDFNVTVNEPFATVLNSNTFSPPVSELSLSVSENDGALTSLSFDPATRTLNGSLANVGENRFSFLASDRCNQTAASDFTVGVLAAPVASPITAPITDSNIVPTSPAQDNTGPIVGGVVGGIAALGVIGGVIGGLLYRRNKQKKEDATTVEPAALPVPTKETETELVEKSINSHESEISKSSAKSAGSSAKSSASSPKSESHAETSSAGSEESEEESAENSASSSASSYTP